MNMFYICLPRRRSVFARTVFFSLCCGALFILLGRASAQNISATVAPNENGSDNYVDIQNTSGGDWYFYTAPTPSGASMSRMDSSEISEYPWPSVGNFAPDSGYSYDRIYPDEYLRVYAGTVASGTTIQVPYATSPLGTRYNFNVTVTSGAEVTAINITDPSPTSAATVHWQVTFDQPVSGVTAANFAFDNPDDITDMQIAAVTPSGSQPTATWTVTATDGSGTGLLGLNWTGHQTESPPVPNSFVGQDYTFSIYPVIEQDLTNVGINIDTTTTMTVGASIRGTATLNYQWYSGTSVNPSAATAISGATSSSYTPPTFGSLGTYQYFCRVYTTTPDYTDSSTANVTVVDPPAITSQPQNVLIADNAQATLSVGASGTSVSYQWYAGTAPSTASPVGDGESTLSLPNDTATGKYWVQVYNAGPTVANSSTVTVTVISSLTSQSAPASAPVNATYGSAFSVAARDTGNNLIANVPVTFTAPASGAGGSFAGNAASATVNTSASGVATAPSFTANGVAGKFSIAVNYGGVTGSIPATNYAVLTSSAATTFLTGISNAFPFAVSGVSGAGFSASGGLPNGVSFASSGVLSGVPAYGTGGTYPLQISLTNSAGLQTPAQFNLTVVEKSAIAARPGFNESGLGWALNGDSVDGGPIVTNGYFVPTDGAAGENRSAWFRYPLYVSAFQASFVYRMVSGGADGMSFAVQNSAAGTTALGFNGGGLGYCGITNSVAVLLNLYSGANGGPSGIMLGTNGVGALGTNGTSSGRSYFNTQDVNLDSSDPIRVNITYVDEVLQVALTDLSNSNTFQIQYDVDLPSMIGTNVAWVGVTGSEGGVYSYQIISNLTFAPYPTLAVQPTNNSARVFDWAGSIVGFILQGKTNLTDATWTSLTNTTPEGVETNEITLPAANGMSFYRLSLP